MIIYKRRDPSLFPLFSSPLFLVESFLLVLLFCGNAHAWNAAGHEAIGMTAMSAIKPDALFQLKRLLGGKDAADVGGWAHKVNAKHPETAAMHFQMQPTDECKTLDLSFCPNGQCLVKAAQHFYMRLVGNPNPIDFPYPGGLKFTDSDALKILITLLGDLHQPLHIGMVSDGGGKYIVGTYMDDGPTNTTLFDFYDSNIVDKMIKERSQFWYSGWTHTNSLRKAQIEAEQQRWDGYSPAERHRIFERWAQESLENACQYCYVDAFNSSKRYEAGFNMGVRNIFSAFEWLRGRVLLAGLRTSFVLNAILNERDTSGRLRQGSAVAIPVVEKSDRRGGQPAQATPRDWMVNAAINFGIFVIIVVIFLYVTKTPFAPKWSSSKGHSKNASQQMTTISKEKEMEKRS